MTIDHELIWVNADFPAAPEPDQAWTERLARCASPGGVKNAAERGKREVLVARFPSDHSTDRRAINHFESDWPEALTGFAKRACKFWQKEPEPHGEKLRAQILDFPGGMPA
jgi:hypothetical protein